MPTHPHEKSITPARLVRAVTDAIARDRYVVALEYPAERHRITAARVRQGVLQLRPIGGDWRPARAGTIDLNLGKGGAVYALPVSPAPAPIIARVFQTASHLGFDPDMVTATARHWTTLDGQCVGSGPDEQTLALTFLCAGHDVVTLSGDDWRTLEDYGDPDDLPGLVASGMSLRDALETLVEAAQQSEASAEAAETAELAALR